MNRVNVLLNAALVLVFAACADAPEPEAGLPERPEDSSSTAGPTRTSTRPAGWPCRARSRSGG